MNKIYLGDCLDILPKLPSSFASVIYIDPPFNTGKIQKRNRIEVTSNEDGDRQGFGGKSYSTVNIESGSYSDIISNYENFLIERIKASLHCLQDNGSLFVHLDYHEVHYIKVALDELLGRDNFINEIIWAYDYGARSKTRWPCKHDTILWYAIDPGNYIFNLDEVDRIPYMAPGLVGEEKAEKGKTPTDTWWHTIVPTNGKEKTGYPTQKPLGILNRIIKVHTNQNDIVLDYFAGSGTTGQAAFNNNRNFILIDENPEALWVMNSRFRDIKNIKVYNSDMTEKYI